MQQYSFFTEPFNTPCSVQCTTANNSIFGTFPCHKTFSKLCAAAHAVWSLRSRGMRAAHCSGSVRCAAHTAFRANQNVPEFTRSQSVLCMQMLNGPPIAVCDKLGKTQNDNKSSGRLHSERHSVVRKPDFITWWKQLNLVIMYPPVPILVVKWSQNFMKYARGILKMNWGKHPTLLSPPIAGPPLTDGAPLH